ncbi:uncharacterized protein LOC144544480 [Carex rostrata]
MGGQDIINLDSSSEEDVSQLQNKEERDGIQQVGFNEIEPGDDPNEQDMDLGDDVIVSNQSVVHETAQLVATRGVKRARVQSTQNEPSVRLVFRSLTRESKTKLMELMQQWCKWQSKHPSASSSMETKEETLESGEEIYYPALHVGSSASKISSMSFWIDNQARTDNVKDESSVPLYDREFTLGSSSLNGSATFERSALDDARCFNCGSYGHALKDCPKPRDMAAINSARQQHSAKKNISNANHGQKSQNRYYQAKPGKYDDLKPGILGPESRECLGIGEFDPPPWLSRMRQMGYPPGYLEIVEDKNKPSGIMIFTDKEEKDINSAKKDDYEEGELPDQSEHALPEKIMTVDFPGINAAIPENADPFLWSVNPPQAPTPIYPPRYKPYDQYNGSSSQSPTLGRSLSDRGRYDGSLNHSPLSSNSYAHQYSSGSSDLPVYHGRDRERDRGRELYDQRRHHHHHRR